MQSCMYRATASTATIVESLAFYDASAVLTDSGVFLPLILQIHVIFNTMTPLLVSLGAWSTETATLICHIALVYA